MQKPLKIELDDLSDGNIIRLLASHRQDMLTHSPAESVHALDSSELFAPELSFWRASIDDTFAACAGLKQLDADSGEVKSMKTVKNFTRLGLAKALLQHVIYEARARDYCCLYLETGTMDAFIPARNLYQQMGFEVCQPFADYTPDPNSVCMRLALA